MSAFRILAGDSSIYLSSNILNAAIPFFLLPILTRALTPAEYGTVTMFSIVLSILSAFTGLSIHGAISTRYFQLDANEHRRYVGTCLMILAVSTFIIFLVVWLCSSLLTKLTHLPTTWLLVAVVVSGFQFLMNIALSLWQVKREAFKYGALQISRSLINAGMSLLLVLVLMWGWQGQVVAQSISILLAGAIALGALAISKAVSLRFDKGHFRDAIRFGTPLIPHALGGLLLVTIDRFMITNMLGLGQAGIYIVGLQIAMILPLLTDSFNKAYIPWLMESLNQENAAINKRIVKFTYAYFVTVIGIALLIGTCAPYVLGILVGREYVSAASVIFYIAGGFAFGGMYYMVTTYIFFYGNTAYLSLVTFTSALINITLNYTLIQYNGITGAGQAFMISQFISFIMTWCIAAKAKKMPWLEFSILRSKQI